MSSRSTPRELNVVLVAAEAAGVRTLKALAASGHVVRAVLAGDGEDDRIDPVARSARELGLPLLPQRRVCDDDFAGWIAAARIDLLLNVHSLVVIPASVLDAVRLGSFNLHPGPLPELAGLNAPSWAIYLGETHHAVTLHWMSAGIDTGPIAYEAGFELGPTDTGLTVGTRCVKLGVPLVARLLEDAAGDPESIPAHPQDLTARRYFGSGPPQEGNVFWARPARDIVAFVRACDYGPFASPWGHPRAFVAGLEISLLEAALTGQPCNEPPGTIGPSSEQGVMVAAEDEWMLLTLLESGGEAVAAQALLRPGGRMEDGAS